jgi:predicted RNase H-like nuclease (RuvC/YqgF family)
MSSCDFCGGIKSISLINDCHHNICEDCIKNKKLKVGDKCPFINKVQGIGDIACGKSIAAFIQIASETTKIFNDLKKETNLDLQLKFLEKAEKGTISFAKNILGASSNIIEQTVKDLAFQQETLKTQMKDLEGACTLLKDELEKLESKQSVSDSDKDYLNEKIQEVYFFDNLILFL